MARPVVVLLFGSLALLYLCSEVSAGIRNHIEPIVSNVYYLQDYCHPPPKEDLEEKYRHRRSSDDSNDETDHDHDHDHINGYDISKDIHQTIKYYANKSYRKVKNEIKQEIKIRQKWKKVILDPVSQPSIVVRLWRPDSVEKNQQHSRILDDVSPKEQIHCKILLQISGNTTNLSIDSSSISSLANSTLGAVVNFMKLNKK